MRIYLPNSAHLQNIEGFIRHYERGETSTLRISTHKTYIHAHPFALAMTACAGALAKHHDWETEGTIPNVSSAPYLVRMKLFDFLQLAAPCKIEEHEEAGRFVPLTQIRTSDDLRRAIADLIPLLHASPEVADPIRYVVSELGRNVLEHAQSPVGGFLCAQYYKNKQRIAIGMVDAGIGITSAIKKSHNVSSEKEAIKLSLTPGVSGTTRRIGGNEMNAGAGLFYIRSIAKFSGNFFVMYSGHTDYKLLRKQSNHNILFGDPLREGHSLNTDLPYWQGTAIGIDIGVDETRKFAALINLISKSYDIDVKKQKKAFYKKIHFT